MDFIIVPTINFKLLYCLVVLHLERRQIAWVGVTSHPTSDWIAQQLAMGIRDRPTSPRSPWQNGYVERVIGSIRRECLDHMIIVGESHLRRRIKAYADFYISARTHLSLGKNAPTARVITSRGMINSIPHLGGLHHHYVRI